MPKTQIHAEKLNLFQRSYLLQAWLGISLALLFGVALAAVQAYLGPQIEANKINETKAQVPELVLGRQAGGEMAAGNEKLTIQPRTMAVDAQGRPKTYTIYKAEYPDGRLAGWVTKANGMGYADRIELLVGLDPGAEKLTGLFILDQKETPGLGNKIIDQAWRDQFIGKSTRQLLTVVKDKSTSGNQINAITGATISSRSVAAIINTAVNDLKQPLAEQAPTSDNGVGAGFIPARVPTHTDINAPEPTPAPPAPDPDNPRPEPNPAPPAPDTDIVRPESTPQPAPDNTVGAGFIPARVPTHTDINAPDVPEQPEPDPAASNR